MMLVAGGVGEVAGEAGVADNGIAILSVVVVVLVVTLVADALAVVVVVSC